MKGILNFMAFAGLVAAIIALCVDSHHYTERVESHLKLAATTEFTDTVSVSLQRALDNLVQMRLNRGNCGVFDKELSTNLSNYFQRIGLAKASVDSLNREFQSDTVSVSASMAQRKVESVVSKMRLALKRADITKEKVKSPKFISLYPYQGLIMVGGTICLIVWIVTGGLCIVRINYY